MKAVICWFECSTCGSLPEARILVDSSCGGNHPGNESLVHAVVNSVHLFVCANNTCVCGSYTSMLLLLLLCVMPPPLHVETDLEILLYV